MLNFPLLAGTKIRIRSWDSMAREAGVDNYGNIRKLRGKHARPFPARLAHLCGNEYAINNSIPKPSRLIVDGDELSTDHIEEAIITKLDWPNENSNSQYTWQRPLVPWKAQPRFLRTPRGVIVAECAWRGTVSTCRFCVRWLWKYAIQPSWFVLERAFIRITRRWSN